MMKIKTRLFGLLAVFVSFGLVSPVLAASTNVTKDGIRFPDGTMQTTAAGSGSTPWIPVGIKDIYYNKGNVGIGTANPEQTLDVTGNIQLNGLAPCIYGVKAIYAPFNSWLQLGAEFVSIDNMLGINNDGNPTKTLVVRAPWGSPQREEIIRLYNAYNDAQYWGIGVDADPGDTDFLFYKRGDYLSWINDNGVYERRSDRRLKKNIEPIESVLDKVLLLQPSYFRWRTSDNDGPKSLGFIAQDVDEIFPTLDIVDRNKEYWGLAYDNFGVLAIAALQELSSEKDTEISELKQQIATLTERIEALERR